MSDIGKSVQDFYDEAGVHFSRTRQKTYGGASHNWPVTDKYLQHLSTGQRVLDIGCGNGKLVSGLPKGVEYLGIDFSHTLIEEAKRIYPDYEFRYSDITNVDTWTKLPEFEAIFCVAVLHHIESRELQIQVLREAKKHLANEGFLYLSVWNLEREKFAQYKVGDHYEIPYNKRWRRYCVAFDIQSLSQLANEVGLKVDEIYYADKAGERVDQENGENLILVAR